jgi:hypothetical protein
VPAGWTVAVVPLSGSVRLEGAEVLGNSVALLGDGDAIALQATSSGGFMLLAGEPIAEPIAHSGPFVMNTPEEVEQAFLDFQRGRMGYLE